MSKEEKSIAKSFCISMGSLLLLTFLAFYMSSCTYNVTMIHTEGEAVDVLDHNHSAEASVPVDLAIPALGL